MAATGSATVMIAELIRARLTVFVTSCAMVLAIIVCRGCQVSL
jgi:hypothetical protein